MPRDEHHAKLRAGPVDPVEVLGQVLAPKVNFLEPVVKHGDVVGREVGRDLLDVLPVLTRERQRDVVPLLHHGNLLADESGDRAVLDRPVRPVELETVQVQHRGVLLDDAPRQPAGLLEAECNRPPPGADVAYLPDPDDADVRPARRCLVHQEGVRLLQQGQRLRRPDRHSLAFHPAVFVEALQLHHHRAFGFPGEAVAVDQDAVHGISLCADGPLTSASSVATETPSRTFRPFS